MLSTDLLSREFRRIVGIGQVVKPDGNARGKGLAQLPITQEAGSSTVAHAVDYHEPWVRYGFADVHINRALRNRLAITGERVPLMVLYYAGNKTDPLAFRYDPWVYEQSPSVPSELAASDVFEVSKPHRVAVWHGGFGAAASRVDGILPRLDGQADSLRASRSRVPQN